MRKRADNLKELAMQCAADAADTRRAGVRIVKIWFAISIFNSFAASINTFPFSLFSVAVATWALFSMRSTQKFYDEHAQKYLQIRQDCLTPP